MKTPIIPVYFATRLIYRILLLKALQPLGNSMKSMKAEKNLSLKKGYERLGFMLHPIYRTSSIELVLRLPSYIIPKKKYCPNR